MSLVPYYLQYLSEICERDAQSTRGYCAHGAGGSQEGAAITGGDRKMGIPAFVKACAEADGTEIPQEEYDSFDLPN